MNPYYKDFSEYMREIYPDFKVQKISVNAGFSCPNRDGTIGTGGCIYCNNKSFTPSYCMDDADSVVSQIEEGKRFFSRKYPEMKYLAYFQSFTNTHGRSVGQLWELYARALSVDDVVGLIVGTRPDTLPAEVISVLGKLSSKVPVFVEIGAETLCDETLTLVNRGHSAADVEDAVYRCAEAGLHVGLHLIAGLPGEDEQRVLDSVAQCCEWTIESLKLHQLQIIRDTTLYEIWRRLNGEIDSGADKNFFMEKTFPHFKLLFDNPEDYADLCCRIIDIVPPRIAIERFLASAPPDMVAAPKWGMKNYEFTNLLHSRLKNRLKSEV